ncbi:MAG: hypothetical protein QXD03_04505 [Candidatus Anstonellales archaeon]
MGKLNSLQKIVNVLNRNYDEGNYASVTEIAKECGISTYTVRDTFSYLRNNYGVIFDTTTILDNRCKKEVKKYKITDKIELRNTSDRDCNEEKKDVKDMMEYIKAKGIKVLSRVEVVDLGVEYNWGGTVGELIKYLNEHGVKINRMYNSNYFDRILRSIT